jgi:hypothetical protein
MTTVHRLGFALLAVMLLGGCGSSEESPSSAAAPVEERPLDEMTRAMDKARAVEDTTLQHKQDMDRALQEMEGGGDN